MRCGREGEARGIAPDRQSDIQMPVIEDSVDTNTITVLVPTFNRLALLRRAVESVLQETRVPIRLKIFDNASTDETEAYATLLAANDKRVSYFRNAANIGSIPNYTQALSTVETEFFVPLADDDWLLPDFLFDAYEILMREQAACAAIFVTEGRDDLGNLVCTYPAAPERIAIGLVQPDQHLRDFMTHGHYGWSSILWRRSMLDVVGAPYFHVGLPSDVDMQLQVFSRLPVFVVNRPGAVYLMHGGQTSQDYGVRHANSWARLFARLDRLVIDSGVLPLDEYLHLRYLMAVRYRNLWTTPSREPLSRADLQSAAWAVGLRLGDWRLAFNLLDQWPKNGLAEQGGSDIIALPTDLRDDGMATFERRATGLRGLGEALLRWMRKNAHERAELIANEKRQGDSLAQTRSALVEVSARNSDLAARLHEVSTRCDSIEQQLAIEREMNAQLKHSLGEAQLVGSLRYVPHRLLAKLSGRPFVPPQRQ
ncbi:MAG: glycosyltransferase [Alcaligenaceae bacterium]|nr:MAG: glycosyltransferase [Alcaligenaceae bacterium]